MGCVAPGGKKIRRISASKMVAADLASYFHNIINAVNYCKFLNCLGPGVA